MWYYYHITKSEKLFSTANIHQCQFNDIFRFQLSYKKFNFRRQCPRHGRWRLVGMPNLLNGGGVVMPATRKMLKLKKRKAMMTMMASIPK